MIIAETINENSYPGYEEDSYDYLFRRKTREERQQNKAERKQKRAERKLVRQEKRQEKKAGTQPGKLPLFRNFGLFNKNKKIESVKSGSAGGTAKNETSNASTLLPGVADQTSLASKLKTTDAVTKEENTPGSESTEAGSEVEKDSGKDGNPQQAGFGPALGFAFAGITLLIVGIALYKTDKKSQQALQPLRVAA